jgi:hypothetical protein
LHAKKSCETPEPLIRLAPLDFDVLELPATGLTHARLAQEVGRSLGFAGSNSPYELMADDATALRYPGVTGPGSWGAMGPAVGSASLKDRGWLPDWQVRTVSGQSGGRHPRPTIGSVTLKPLVLEGERRGGVVRLEIGGYALEMRAKSSWDRGIPKSSVVLAYQVGVDSPTLLYAGDEVGSGGNHPEITGGVRVAVTKLTDTEALISYFIVDRPFIVVGGGTLRGGGTILIGADGTITRIPPGDPYEKHARRLVQRDIGALVKKVSKLRQQAD